MSSILNKLIQRLTNGIKSVIIDYEVKKMQTGTMLMDLTIKQAAGRLGVNPGTLWRWIQRDLKRPEEEKKFPNAFKKNPDAQTRSEWLIPESDLEDFEKRRRGQ